LSEVEKAFAIILPDKIIHFLSRISKFFQAFANGKIISIEKWERKVLLLLVVLP
jgi:hypothetical protein